MAHTAHIIGEEFWFQVADAGADAHQTLLLFYLVAPPDARSWAGVRRLLPREVLAFMPHAGLEGIEAALAGLQETGLISYDPDTHLVYTPIVVQMQPYRGHNAVQGALNGGLKDFPDSWVLAPALEHLAVAEEEAADEAREKAEAMREGEKKAKALALVEKMNELARELRARLARILERGTPFEGGPKGVRRGSEGASEGVRRGSEGGSPGGEILPENEVDLPETGQNASRITPFEGGSKGVNAPGPIPLPIPLPSPEDPSQKGFPKPVEGRCREGPPESLGEVLDKIRDRGGSG